MINTRNILWSAVVMTCGACGEVFDQRAPLTGDAAVDARIVDAQRDAGHGHDAAAIDAGVADAPATIDAITIPAAVFGTIVDEQGLPVDGAWVQVYVSSTSGTSGHVISTTSYGGATTNAQGQYSVTNVPAAGVAMLHIEKPGYAQPCFAIGPYGNGESVTGQVHSHAYLSAGGPAPSIPIITGTVVEVVNGTTQPVAGVQVRYDWLQQEFPSEEWWVGSTITNSAGHYYVCGTSTKFAMVFSKAGFISTARAPSDPDVEMIRQ